MKAHVCGFFLLVSVSVGGGCSRAEAGRIGGTATHGEDGRLSRWHESIRRLRTQKTATLREEAHRLGLRYPLRRVFLRAFKEERRLELWAADGAEPMRRVRNYVVAAASGGPGPKRREGDQQVPEGAYRIDRFNPNSRFHLSLGLDYPNASDRRRGGPRLGGDIFIHGNRVSIGCLAMTDRVIDEIYPVCESAENRRSIPVHVFPCRMDGPAMADLSARHPEHRAFWGEIGPIYRAFETTRRVPRVRVSPTGAYEIAHSIRI